MVGSAVTTKWRYLMSCARSLITSSRSTISPRCSTVFHRSNDMTQLILGVDRDSELVAFDFDERDPGVHRDAAPALIGRHAIGRTSAFAARRPPIIPAIAPFLAANSVFDAMSVNAASLLRTMEVVYEVRPARSKSEAPPSRRRRCRTTQSKSCRLRFRGCPVTRRLFRVAFKSYAQSYADRTASEQEKQRSGWPGRPSRSAIARAAVVGGDMKK